MISLTCGFPGIVCYTQGSARQLFQRLQGPVEEDTLKSHFETICSIGKKFHQRFIQVCSPSGYLFLRKLVFMLVIQPYSDHNRSSSCMPIWSPSPVEIRCGFIELCRGHCSRECVISAILDDV